MQTARAPRDLQGLICSMEQKYPFRSCLVCAALALVGIITTTGWQWSQSGLHEVDEMRGAPIADDDTRPMIAYYVHMQKTGGDSILDVVKCLVEESDNTSSLSSSDGARTFGRWMRTPLGARLMSAEQWTSLCAPVKRPIDATPLHIDVRTGDYNVGRCMANHHWHVEISDGIAEHLQSSGLRPVVVGSVRNPFAFYLSWYFFHIEQREQERRRARYTTTPDSEAVRAGRGRRRSRKNPWSEHPYCLERPQSRKCIAEFQSWLTLILGACADLHRCRAHPPKDSMTAKMAKLYGSHARLVPEWAWIRTEHLYADAAAVHARLTSAAGLPARCPPSSVGHRQLERRRERRRHLRRQLAPATHHGPVCDYYTRKTTALVRNADRWIFRRFSYSAAGPPCSH